MIAYVLPSLVKLGSRTPEKSVSCDPHPKIARKNVLNHRQLSHGLFDFAQILYGV